MTYKTTSTVTIRHRECGSCGVIYGLSESFIEARREDHRTFYCPNGCARHFAGKTKAEELANRLAAQKRRSEYLEAERDRARRQAETSDRRRAAAKGQLTKVKNRIAKGACPCCNRHFENLHEHMQTQHPDYAEASND